MIVSAILARNEKSRYLPQVIANAKTFADEILLLDDNSTDGTAEFAKQQGCRVRSLSSKHPMWGQESGARQRLWTWGAEVAGKDGWLLIQDADQTLHGPVKDYCQSTEVNAWAFVLYDLWDTERTYRCDGYWKGHTVPRPWLFRPSAVPVGYRPEWSSRGVHVGHAPANWPMVCGVAPDVFWKHFSYLKPDDRKKKHQQYLAQAHQLGPYELAHAQSIAD